MDIYVLPGNSAPYFEYELDPIVCIIDTECHKNFPPVIDDQGDSWLFEIKSIDPEIAKITTISLPQYNGNIGMIKVSPTNTTETGSYTLKLMGFDFNRITKIFFSSFDI